MAHTIVPLLSSVLSFACAYFETKHTPTLAPHELSLYYPITPLILTLMAFWILSHGFVVGAARSKYMTLAKKDSEKDIPERYALPNLYAQGTSQHVRAFNCVQRSHQHIFETWPTTILTSMIGAVVFPISVACFTGMLFIGRMSFTRAYAKSEGDVSKRYNCPLAQFLWVGLLCNIVMALLACVTMLKDVKLFKFGWFVGLLD